MLRMEMAMDELGQQDEQFKQFEMRRMFEATCVGIRERAATELKVYPLDVKALDEGEKQFLRDYISPKLKEKDPKALMLWKELSDTYWDVALESRANAKVALEVLAKHHDNKTTEELNQKPGEKSFSFKLMMAIAKVYPLLVKTMATKMQIDARVVQAAADAYEQLSPEGKVNATRVEMRADRPASSPSPQQVSNAERYGPVVTESQKRIEEAKR